MNKKIFWAGDSTVAYNDISSYPQTGIGQVMDLYLHENVEIHNFAKNGRSTKSFIEEGLLKDIDKLIEKGDFLFIQFGHNDQKEEEDRRTEPFSTYQEYIKQYIEIAIKHGAFPVLITPVYRRIFEKSGHIRDEVHLDYPKAMLEIGERLNVPTIDLCRKSKKLLEKTGDSNSKKWFMHLQKDTFENYSNGLQDDTHMRYEGAVKIAGLVAQGLKELDGIYAEVLSEYCKNRLELL
jgi:lysophospholipase L1-like esterase